MNLDTSVFDRASSPALLLELGGKFLEACLRVDAWQTTYIHVLTGEDPVLEWFKGSALRPLLQKLDKQKADQFLAQIADRFKAAYPAAQHSSEDAGGHAVTADEIDGSRWAADPAAKDEEGNSAVVLREFLKEGKRGVRKVKNHAECPKANMGFLFVVQCSVAFKHKNWEFMMSEKNETWVVYLMTGKKTNGMKAVCQETEWEAMEKAKPGQHNLIQKGIASESEAERLARGVSGDSKPRTSKFRCLPTAFPVNTVS